jgi:ATP-grasp domain
VWRGRCPGTTASAGAGIGARRDGLLGVSRLAGGLPQVAGLDVNPVIARPDGAVAVGARIRMASRRLVGPFLCRRAQ